MNSHFTTKIPLNNLSSKIIRQLNFKNQVRQGFNNCTLHFYLRLFIRTSWILFIFGFLSFVSSIIKTILIPRHIMYRHVLSWLNSISQRIICIIYNNANLFLIKKYTWRKSSIFFFCFNGFQLYKPQGYHLLEA